MAVRSDSAILPAAKPRGDFGISPAQGRAVIGASCWFVGVFRQ